METTVKLLGLHENMLVFSSLMKDGNYNIENYYVYKIKVFSSLMKDGNIDKQDFDAFKARMFLAHLWRMETIDLLVPQSLIYRFLAHLWRIETLTSRILMLSKHEGF